MNIVEDFFQLKKLNTNLRTELIAGFTTFMTMAYIIFVNPAILSVTGMDFGTVIGAVCGTSTVTTYIESASGIGEEGKAD